MRRAAIVLGGAACLLLAWRPSAPRLLWNATESVPVGLYRLTQRAPGVGDFVAFDPPPQAADWLARGGWLPRGVPLVKPVVALSGRSVCRMGDVVMVEGAAPVAARRHDGAGRSLPRWRGCRRLASDEIFVLSPARGSFDGRYLGPTPLSSVRGVARPIWTRSRAAKAGEP